MLFGLHIEVAHKLVGRSPAEFFEHSTGISRMTYQRGRAYAVWMQRREREQAHADSLLLRMMERRSTTDAARHVLREAMPKGISALMVYAMGLLDGAAPATRDLVRMLDASDRKLSQLADDDDGEGFAAEMGPESELGPNYYVPLYVSGLTRFDLEMDDQSRFFLIRVLTRRAHMALSFLAAVDHEISRWDSRSVCIDAFNGLPRFAALLLDPEMSRQRTRFRPDDPIARLVDFVGAVGHRSRTGSWPVKPLSIEAMGAQAELSGVVAGSGARFVRGLRGGKHPMTRAAFHLLVRSQLTTGRIDMVALQAMEDSLEPYVVAAHLLELLMAPHKRARGHLDRFGWRAAYLNWWERAAVDYPPTQQLDGDPPPSWLC